MSLQNPPYKTTDSQAAYTDFLKGLDEINQQEYLNDEFTGKNAKKSSQLVKKLFEDIKLPGKPMDAGKPSSNAGKLTLDEKPGATLDKLAEWERQVFAAPPLPRKPVAPNLTSIPP